MQIKKKHPAGIAALTVILAVTVCLAGCGKDNTQSDGMLKEINESLREQLASREERINSLEEEIDSLNLTVKALSEENEAGKHNTDVLTDGNESSKQTEAAIPDENGSTEQTEAAIPDENGSSEQTEEALPDGNESPGQQDNTLPGNDERENSMNEYALVNVPVITLYENASDTAECVDEALYGMKVRILEENGEFVKVLTHYRYEGYVKKSELLFSDELINVWENNEHAIILAGTADILTEPAFKGSRIINIPRAAQVIVTGETTGSGWTKVILADGTAGYVRSSFLGECLDSMYVDIFDQSDAAAFLMENYDMSEEEFRSNVTELALTYLGTQYRWGGKSTLGIDCSGICGICYMMSGICIYRDAKIVDGFAVHSIDRKDIKKGDLLFFKGHVAMYLGDGKYVHSTGKVGSDGVVINSLNPADSDYREDLDKGMIACGSIFR